MNFRANHREENRERGEHHRLSRLDDLVASDYRNVLEEKTSRKSHQQRIAVTKFEDQVIFGFSVNPDGKSLVVARGRLSRDAVLITGFR